MWTFLSVCILERDDLRYADVASVVDFDSEDSDVDFWFNLDEGLNGALGMKRTRWSFKMRLEFSAGLSCSLSGCEY